MSSVLKEKFIWQRSGQNFKQREQQERRYQGMKEHNADTPLPCGWDSRASHRKNVREL